MFMALMCIKGLNGKAVDVSCGGSHTAVITGRYHHTQDMLIFDFTEDGALYTFGEGANGQLGHGTLVMQADEPRLVTSTNKHKLVSVSCGEAHTAVISGR